MSSTIQATASASNLSRQSPPIASVAPFIWSALSLLASSLITTFKYSITIAGYLYHLSPHHVVFSLLSPVLRYVLDPFVVIYGFAIQAFISTPWRMALQVLHDFHPIYTLCATACLAGAFIGISGRLVSAILVNVVADDEVEDTERAPMKEDHLSS